MPDRNIPEDLKAAQEIMEGDITGVDIIKALKNSGFEGERS